MRSLLPALAITLFIAAPLHGQAGARRAAPSTLAVAEVSLTLTDTAAQRIAGKPALIRMEYGQPHLRGRRINTDSLVPFDKVWRLGANAATLFSTDVDLMVGSVAVSKGRYVAQVLPTRTGWTLILQAETSGASSVAVTAYDMKKDAARIPLVMRTVSSPTESFSVWLIPATTPGVQKGELRMAWDTTVLGAEWVVR